MIAATFDSFDLVFTADPILVSQVTSLDHFSFLDSVSDHTALVLCLNILYKPATETPTEKHFDFRRANLFLLKTLITAVNWEMLLANTTIDTNIDTMRSTFYDMFWSICDKCVPTVTSSSRRQTSNYPQHIVKLGSKCKRLSTCKTSGMLQWRTAQRAYMLAIQNFVNSRECTVIYRPCTHWQFYPTRVPFANGSRQVARVHTASTASGSSGKLRPHQEVFAVDANGSRRVGSAVWMLEWTRRTRRTRRVGSGAPSAHDCWLTYLFLLH